MRQVSKSQAEKNREVARIKKTKPDVCIICQHPIYRGQICDGVHLMNKNIYPAYYTEERNVWKGHRQCHTRYDDDKKFRGQQAHIIEIAKQYATTEEINRYFY